MTASELPSEKQLADELQRLCGEIGYRAGTTGTEAMRRIPGLIGLSIVGGPAEPAGILEWRKRRDAVRTVLREVAEQEVVEELDERYSEAAIKIFRLDAKRPLERAAHVPLSEIQAPLDEEFGGESGGKSFQNNYRPLLIEVVARSLLGKERRAREAAELPTPSGKTSSAEGKKAVRVTNKPGSSTAKTRPPVNAAGTKQKRARVPPPRKRRKPAGQFSKGLPTAAADQAGGNQSEAIDIEHEKPIALIGAIGILLAVGIAVFTATFGHYLLLGRFMTPVKFSVQVTHWSFRNRNPSTDEAEIKIKPRFVNHSLRPIDLQSGANARLALAIYAPYLSQQSAVLMLPPYRRAGNWLLVPPIALNAPLSSYGTDLTRSSLGPLDSYIEPRKHRGDLTFDVVPYVLIEWHAPRIVYRLSNGRVYFPPGGAFSRWRGHTNYMNF